MKNRFSFPSDLSCAAVEGTLESCKSSTIVCLSRHIVSAASIGSHWNTTFICFSVSIRILNYCTHSNKIEGGSLDYISACLSCVSFCPSRIVLMSTTICQIWTKNIVMCIFLVKILDVVDNQHLTSWWLHQVESFSTWLALCVGNTPVPVNSLHKGQWCGALMFSLICTWINDWVNNCKTSDLRGHVIITSLLCSLNTFW